MLESCHANSLAISEQKQMAAPKEMEALKSLSAEANSPKLVGGWTLIKRYSDDTSPKGERAGDFKTASCPISDEECAEHLVIDCFRIRMTGANA